MKIAALLLAVLVSFAGNVFAQDSNYPDRRAIIVNTSPHVELSNFSFSNRYADRRTRFEQNLKWTNRAAQPIVALEVVILKYDAFDERLIGSRWTITGTDSANWRPLAPGASASDGTISYRTEEVFTAIAYVRSARLADGTIWRVSEAALRDDLRKVVPGMKSFGDVNPDPRPVQPEPK